MQHKVSKNHINNLNELISEKLVTKLNENEINDILNNINELLDIDTIQTIHNKEIPTKHLFIFNLINEYHNAYQLSKDTFKKQRTNTLESLDKRNANRKKRYEDNELSLKNKNIHWSNRLVYYYENLILHPILNGKQKFAYLLLSVAFIYKNYLPIHLKYIFKYNKDFQISLSKFEDSLQFFSFTYLSPSKIVVSISILLYQYLKEHTELQDDKILKFIRYIVNFYFKEDAPSRLQEGYFIREVYCAGIYNNTPIFQWYTSTKNTEYYTQYEIRRLQIFYKKAIHKIKLLKYVVSGYFGKKRTSQEIEQLLNPTPQDMKSIIKNLPLAYMNIEQIKLYNTLQVRPPKTLKYYLLSPIRLIYTLFVAFYTKLITK